MAREALRRWLASLALPGLLCAAWAGLGVAVPAMAQAAPAVPAENGAVVLMYHRFGENEYPSTNIRLEQFAAHLAELKHGPFHVLPLGEIVTALREGKPLPDHAVAITIDDAYLSVYTQAWPRLKAAGFPFTLFVATDPLDKGYGGMLTWAELREMVASGLVTVGNHTASHPHMVELDARHNRLELRHASERIRKELGISPTLLAYPYGEYSREVEKVAREEGFVAAFGQQSGAIARNADRFALPRFALNEHYGTPERFAVVADALPLPVTDVTPPDMLLPRKPNPPHFAFRVAEALNGLSGMTCYASTEGKVKLTFPGGRRVKVRLTRPLPVGRSRVNCTLQAPDGRWRWYGVQFYLPSR